MSEEEYDENDEEVELPEDDDDFEPIEYVYGIEMPSLPEGLQPLECVVLLKGIMMDSGMPTITAMGSEGMAPWEAVGMLQMEAHRLIQGYSFGGFEYDHDHNEEDDEDEDL